MKYLKFLLSAIQKNVDKAAHFGIAFVAQMFIFIPESNDIKAALTFVLLLSLLVKEYLDRNRTGFSTPDILAGVAGVALAFIYNLTLK